MGDVLQMLLKQLSGGGGGGKGKGWGKGGGTWKKTTKMEKDTSGGELGEHIGVIAKQGFKYSFIESETLKEAGYGDIFVWWDEVKGYKKGQTVKFTAFLSKEGKLQAKDLKSGL